MDFDNYIWPRVTVAVVLLVVCGVLLLAISTIEGLGTCNSLENLDCPPEQSPDLPLYTGSPFVMAGCILTTIGRPAAWCMLGGVGLGVVGVAVAAAVTF